MENLIQKIPNQVVASFLSIQHASKIESYQTIEFFDALFALPPATAGESFAKVSDHPFDYLFKHINTDLVSSYLWKYYQFLEKNTKKDDFASIDRIVSIAKNEKFEFDGKQKLIDDLNIKKLSILIEANCTKDYFVTCLLNNSNKQIQRLVRQYSHLRFNNLKSPTKLEHIKMGSEILKLPTYKSKLHDVLIMASGRLDDRWSSSDDLPKLDIDSNNHLNISIAMFKGLTIAGSYVDSRKALALLQHQEVISVCGKEPGMRNCVTKFMVNLMRSKFNVQQSIQYRKVLSQWKLLKTIPKFIISSSLVDSLVAGSLETAHQINIDFNYPINEDVYRSVVNILRNQQSDLLAQSITYLKELLPTYSFGSSRDKLECKSFSTVLEIEDKLNLISNYFKNGRLSTLDDVVEIDFDSSYSGKFMLFNFRGKVIVRTLTGLSRGSDMHKDIVAKTDKEIKQLGFSDYAQELQGAHLRFVDENTIKLYDQSYDFGECDKELAKSVIQKHFPEHKIIIERAK